MKRNSLLFTLLCLCTLCLIVGCNGDGVLMRQQLEELEQQNSKGEKLVDDSLAESLVTILPNEIAKLEKCIPSYVSYIRKNLLKKVFGKDGNADEFDDEIGNIGKKT